MDLGEELNALYTDVLHNRCIFTVKLSKLICHAPKLGIIFDTHYKYMHTPITHACHYATVRVHIW